MDVLLLYYVLELFWTKDSIYIQYYAPMHVTGKKNDAFLFHFSPK